MYTNWPFTAKHIIHVSEFGQRRLSTETDLSIKNAN